MIKTAVALSALLAVGSAGAAVAQEQIEPPAISGTVQSVDPATRSVVLDNGQTYVLGDSADVGSLQEGSRVDLSCDTDGANCMVVTADMPNDVGPESGTEPSAGSNQGDSGSEGETVPPSNATPPDGSGTTPDGGGAGDSGGSY
jgi:Protein of unknown function (DUF1344)